MRKDLPPKTFVLAVLRRSACNVKVGALIVDRKGRYISWGHNHAGPDSKGVHAEVHAISRSNPKRLKGSTIYVAGVRGAGNNRVKAKPCPSCMSVIRAVGIAKVIYCNKQGGWDEIMVS